MAKKMEVNTKNMTLIEKLAEIKKLVDVIQKNRSGYNYKYVTTDEILARVTLGMNTYRVFLYPTIVPQTTEVTMRSYTKTKYKGDKVIEEQINEVVVKADMLYTWVNVDDTSDTLVVPWVFVGQQADASQAVGSGLSYLERYFLMKFFQIATPEDDPDNWRSKQMEIERAEEMKAIGEVIDDIDSIVSAALDGVEDAAEKNTLRKNLLAVVKKYARDKDGKPSGNYRLITNMEDAMAVKNGIKTTLNLGDG